MTAQAEMTDKEQKVIDRKTQNQIKDHIITARIGLLLRHPWFGNMATRMRVVCADEWCSTAATNGRDLFYNTQFFLSLSTREIEFVIAHEIMHCVYDHFTRRLDRLPVLHNIACDYIVNNMLIHEGIGELPTKIKPFYDKKYQGMTSEEVYDILFKKGQEQLEQLGQLLDQHIDWGTGDDTNNDNASGAPVLTDEEQRQISDEFKEGMIAAARTCAPGQIPEGVKRIIHELTEPKLNWRELLQQQIHSMVRNDYSFTRPSRKSWHTGAILPGMEREQALKIAIALDMSGSISDEDARDFLSEVKGIMDQYADYYIDIWTFDTDVYNHETFTSDDGDDIANYELRGGGGTSFQCNWDYMDEQGLVPDKLLMFTDMYSFDGFGDPNYCDTIFINHGDSDMEADHGITVKYSCSS